MSKMHTPKDSDPLGPDRTEPRVPPMSNYIDSIGGKNFQRTQKVQRVAEKPNNEEISKRNYKLNYRHMNRNVKEEKKLAPAHYEMRNVDPKYDEPTLLREMRKMGINPMDMKISHNTITHDNKAKGYFFINSDNKTK